MARILVVEDEPPIASALEDDLKLEGYEVEVIRDGDTASRRAREQSFDLIILDVMLPHRDGIEILQTLRRQGMKLPVLLLTAKDAVEDRVLGLDSGADDYLIKPFAFPELGARVRALLRRNKADSEAALRIGDLEIDSVRRTVARHEHRVELTAREFELLEYLARNHSRVVSREMLARDVWKETARATPLDNVIDVHIARLRKKLDDPFDKKLLHTVRGVGFTLDEEEP